MKKYILLAVTVLFSFGFVVINHYPIDGYEHTGIKRLKRLELVKSGEIKETSKLPEGAMKSWMRNSTEPGFKNH